MRRKPRTTASSTSTTSARSPARIDYAALVAFAIALAQFGCGNSARPTVDAPASSAAPAASVPAAPPLPSADPAPATASAVASADSERHLRRGARRPRRSWPTTRSHRPRAPSSRRAWPLRGGRQERARARGGLLVSEGAVHPAEGHQEPGQVLGPATPGLRERRACAPPEAQIVGRRGLRVDALIGTMVTVVISPEGAARVELSGAGLFSSERAFFDAVGGATEPIMQAIVGARTSVK